MDFRHLIVTCLFSKLRLPFDNQKVKENYAIFQKKLEGFSGVGQHQSHSAHCLDFDLRIIFKQLAKFVDKYVQAA